MISPEFPNDRDYFIDDQGDIYQVLGYVHPKDKIVCLKKYRKIGADENYSGFFWHSNITKQKYERVISGYSTQSADKNIASHPYQAFFSIYGSTFILFPKDKIQIYFHPNDKLHVITSEFQDNLIQYLSQSPPQKRDALELLYIIEEQCDVSLNDMGITGSLLWDGVHSGSDIDIIIYGIQNHLKFIENAMKLPKRDKRFRRLAVSEIFTIGSKFSEKTGMPVDDCIVYTNLKKYLFYFGKYFLSIAFCPNSDEIVTNPMANHETECKDVPEMNRVTIRAKIDNLDWSYCYPSLIYLRNVEFVSNGKRDSKKKEDLLDSNKIIRALIFEREITGYFNIGDDVIIQGLVQQIVNIPNLYPNNRNPENTGIGNNIIYQIVLGTRTNFGKEYIKNLSIK